MSTGSTTGPGRRPRFVLLIAVGAVILVGTAQSSVRRYVGADAIFDRTRGGGGL